MNDAMDDDTQREDESGQASEASGPDDLLQQETGKGYGEDEGEREEALGGDG